MKGINYTFNWQKVSKYHMPLLCMYSWSVRSPTHILFSAQHHCWERCHSSQAILGVRCSEKHHHVHLQIEPPCGRLVVGDLVREDGAIVLLAMALWEAVLHHVVHCLRLVVDWAVSLLLEHYIERRKRQRSIRRAQEEHSCTINGLLTLEEVEGVADVTEDGV